MGVTVADDYLSYGIQEKIWHRTPANLLKRSPTTIRVLSRDHVPRY
jgi:hypothetical protein